MKLSQVCIERPVLTSVLSLMLIIFGILGYLQLQVRFQPQVFQPHLSIVTNYANASAALVEQNITQPLEQVLASTPDVQEMRSQSRFGQSHIFLSFATITEQQFVTLQSQVLQEIAGVHLPQSVKNPVMYTSNDDNEIMDLGLVAPSLDKPTLINYLNNVMVPRLETLPGVGTIDTWAPSTVLRIALDPVKLAAVFLTVTDVINAIENNNVALSVGEIYNETQEVPLNAILTLPDMTAFKNLVVAKQNNRLVKMSDIADVSVDQSTLGFFSFVNGMPGVGADISATDDGNPIRVSEEIHHALNTLKSQFPNSMHVQVIYDLGGPLKDAVQSVFVAIIEAIMLVILVTFLFLGNVRATSIPVVTIPVCIIATFMFMFILGFTIDVMTLLALVLAVGLVVDDAIVVLENTYRHIEQGESPFIAAKNSIHEIGFAVIAITICLVAVYIPVGLIGRGYVSIYFREFGFTLAAAVLLSGLLAITLSPMMCSRLLQRKKLSPYENRLEAFTERLKAQYYQTLMRLLSYKKRVLAGFLFLLAGGIYLGSTLPTDLLPSSEIDNIFAMLTGPNSASHPYMEQQATQIYQNMIAPNKNIDSSFIWSSSANQIGLFLRLTPQSERSISNDEIANQLNQQFALIPALQGGAFVMNANNLSGSSHSGNLFFYITGFTDFETLSRLADNLIAKLSTYKGLSHLYNNLQFNSFQYNLTIDRNLVNTLGVNINDLTNAISTFYGGYITQSQFQYGGYGYDIIIQLPAAELKDLSTLDKIKVKNQKGQMIPLSRFVTITPIFDLPYRPHIDQMRAAEIDANIMPGYTMGQVIQKINQVAKQVLPSDITVSYGGQAKQVTDQSGSVNLLFVLGIVFIYLVLAALFESFIDPFVILFTVPLSMIGALFSLKITGGSLNIYTGIALVTLIGLICKHGVLITQFANQLHQEGKDLTEAVVEGASIRLRPILMTSATMILGALPLVFATGTDATGRREIGIVIVSGLVVGTFFSLFVVPVAYTIFAGFKRKFKH